MLPSSSVLDTVIRYFIPFLNFLGFSTVKVTLIYFLSMTTVTLLETLSCLKKKDSLFSSLLTAVCTVVLIKSESIIKTVRTFCPLCGAHF